jgi:hypothetical protein
MKKKKAKWSVISATSLTFLTFVGLVTGNANGTSTSEESVAINNENTSIPLEDSESVEETTEESSWSQSPREDRSFDAPSSGYEQGSGSSGSSR